ncbi:hypothetical protein [Nevskia sp.]|uniref:hypothetical protein n=1 Tax=Nevskia sp. TaxID=1929292 RepID=UPI0025EE798A|nr:hypothetical protein [Nevskia sp.]
MTKTYTLSGVGAPIADVTEAEATRFVAKATGKPVDSTEVRAFMRVAANDGIALTVAYPHIGEQRMMLRANGN